jgi:glutamate N-acetyltransferase/amino-acid N-acetyltransferase
MTTDTVAKHVSATIKIGDKDVTLGGMTKGAGMIAPLMRLTRIKQATMLAYITTDACISPDVLESCLSRSLDESFNRIIIDGDMSTNDTLIALANGQAGNPLIVAGTPESEEFRRAFRDVLAQLAREMVLDGEGVSKFVEVNISGAQDGTQARRIAEAIARSPLCKTAWYGNDPNWGRILDAAGYSGAKFAPQEVSLDINGTPFVRNGMGAGRPQAELEAAVKPREMKIDLKVGEGIGAFTIWTCDLTHDYVKINADYHT